MDSKELKALIFEEGTVGKLLDELGCHNIRTSHYGTGDPLITAALPDGDNLKGVQVYLNENLTTNLVTRGISGDIYSLVGYILYDARSFDDVKQSFYQITQYICNTLGYESNKNFFDDKKEAETDWNWWLREIQSKRPKKFEITDNPIIDEHIMNEFVPYPCYKWYTKDGISYDTQMTFQIGFHINTDRVSIPLHNKHGQLIGVKGRYMGDDQLIENNKKYNYIYPCSKTIELYGLHRTMSHIQEKKEVIVVEGAKSVIKFWDLGIKNCVSIEGDKISPVQVLLLKELGLDISIVAAFDKDKDEEYIQQQIKQIKNRELYYLFDKENRFTGKDSPCDKELDVFLDIYNKDKYQYKQV